jgi:hypothetical protein
VYTGDQSESWNVKSFGSRIVSHGNAGDNTEMTDSPTAAAVPVESCYFVIKVDGLKTFEASLSSGTWTFACNKERKLTSVYQVRCVFILYMKSFKFKFFLWLVFTHFCDT